MDPANLKDWWGSLNVVKLNYKYNLLHLSSSIPFRYDRRIQHLLRCFKHKAMNITQREQLGLNYGVSDQRIPAAEDILRTIRNDYIGNKVYINEQLNKIITDFGGIMRGGSNNSEYYAVRERQNNMRYHSTSTEWMTYLMDNYYNIHIYLTD